MLTELLTWFDLPRVTVTHKTQPECQLCPWKTQEIRNSRGCLEGRSVQTVAWKDSDRGLFCIIKGILGFAIKIKLEHIFVIAFQGFNNMLLYRRNISCSPSKERFIELQSINCKPAFTAFYYSSYSDSCCYNSLEYLLEKHLLVQYNCWNQAKRCQPCIYNISILPVLRLLGVPLLPRNQSDSSMAPSGYSPGSLNSPHNMWVAPICTY